MSLAQSNNVPRHLDPRPDLSGDSALWDRLLSLAAQRSSFLAATLHGFRCQGTIITTLPSGRYALRPLIGDNGWPSEEAYTRDKAAWLEPYRNEIALLLRTLLNEQGT